jgi:uncharacterized protein YaiE (UPF0345 family)
MLDLGAAMTYDLSKLSGAVWGTGAAWDGGTAPEITTTTETQQNVTRLIVKITDADGDLARTAYSAGTLSAEQFSAGGVGHSFSVGSDGTITFTVTGNGTYTFYAADSAGNETVKTVTVSCETQRPSMWNGIGGRWMGTMPTAVPFPRWMWGG